MAATSAATLSIGTNVSLGRKVGSLSQSKPFGVRFNSQNSLKSFSGLKAATSVSCESDSSFLGEETIAALRGSIALKAQKENQSYQYHLQPQAAFKVAILGAAGGIGQPLALLIKMSPSRRELHLLISKQWLHKFQVFEVLTSLHQCVREM